MGLNSWRFLIRRALKKHKVRLAVCISAKLSISRMYWQGDALVVYLS